jgi:hypothetical protein
MPVMLSTTSCTSPIDSATVVPTLSVAPLAIQPHAPYRCFVCGALAEGLNFWPVLPGHSPLDAYAAHIAYLVLPCGCGQVQRSQEQGTPLLGSLDRGTDAGCARVAFLDGAILPLRFAGRDEIPAFESRTAYNVSAVEAALALLTAALDDRADQGALLDSAPEPVGLGRGGAVDPAACPHPPSRLYAWFADDTLCAGCCACGAVLSGGAA